MTYKILLENGRIKTDPTIGSTLDQQSYIQQAIEKASSEGKPLVLHFHGGLVSRTKGVMLADRLQKEYIVADGVPLFFVWQTGFLETIRINYTEALNGRLFKWAMKILFKKFRRSLSNEYLLEHSLTSIVDDALVFTDADFRRLQAELNADPDFDVISRDLVNAVNQELGNQLPEAKQFRSLLNTCHMVSEQDKREASTLNPDLFIDWQTPGFTRGLISVAAFKVEVINAIRETIIGVIKRYRDKTEHGPQATVTEELSRRILGDVIGAEIWGFMKKDAKDAFTKGSEYAGYFLLQCLQQSNPRPRVVVVGHSAGSIFVCHLLAAAESGNFDVAFLAPAVTSELFDHTIQNYEDRVGNFRMFTMKDNYERNDNLVDNVPWLYPSSLLYLISGILEVDADQKSDIDKPLLGMERFYLDDYAGRPDDIPMLRRVKKFLNDGRSRVVWSVANHGPGLRTESRDHGCFDEDPGTVESLKYLIKYGY